MKNLGRIQIRVYSDPVRLRSWIRIRMDMRKRIRIRTKSVRIHNTDDRCYHYSRSPRICDVTLKLQYKDPDPIFLCLEKAILIILAKEPQISCIV